MREQELPSCSCPEVADYRLANVLTEGIEVIRLGESRMPQCFGSQASAWVIL
jgi:hypothetical protein